MPEAVGGVDSGPFHSAVEFRGVDGAEFVGTDGVVAEVGGEDGHGEGGDRVVEEGLLLRGLHGVEFGEGETDEAVGLCVLDEGGGYGSRELDGLGGDGCAADVHGVGSDISCSAGAVAVGDGERGTLDEFEGCGFLGVEVRVAGLRCCCELGVEDPEIGGSRIEIHDHGLASDADGS